MIFVQEGGMEEIQCKNLDDLIEKMQENGDWGEGILYRWHEDSSWELASTLNRFIKGDVSVRDYNHWLDTIKPELQSFSGQKFDSVHQQTAGTNSTANTNTALTELLIYTRQHSFPSPVIDFTRSFYVALFFAVFKMQIPSRNAKRKFSIITTFADFIKLSKNIERINTGNIHFFHKRHYVQQAVYLYNIAGTLSNKTNNEGSGEEPKYTQITEQFFRKYSVPITERVNIIEELNLMNINPYTLFETDDALMQTLAWKYNPVYNLKSWKSANVVAKVTVPKIYKINGLIRTLSGTNNYQRTHDAIVRLDHLLKQSDKLLPEDARKVLSASLTNDELKDPKILSFYVSRINRKTLSDEDSVQRYDIIK